MLSDYSQPSIKTVSQITNDIKSFFDHRFQFVRISGEISNVRRPHSGHHYFYLKDDSAQIRAVLFKNHSRNLQKQLSDGQQVICDGRITVYEPRGEYQIIVDSVDFCGAGHLQIAFERLKNKLNQEGLFDRDKKKKIPPFIEKIILITSPTGAAVHDFLSVCFKRNANLCVQLLPVRVQGTGAAAEIVSALKIAEKLQPDVILLCRGGGSTEDLWTFNEESVARSIHGNSIPVVSAIGHEIDVTIADYCADFRCATPTAAAELLVPSAEQLGDTVSRLLHRVARSMQWRLETVQYRVPKMGHFLSLFDALFFTRTMQLDSLKTKLAEMMSSVIEHKQAALQFHLSHLEQLSPAHKLNLHQVRLKFCTDRLLKGINFQLERKFSRLQETAAVLDSVSPLATLSRGYAIVCRPDTDVVIYDSAEVKIGESVDVRLHRGALNCRIVKRR